MAAGWMNRALLGLCVAAIGAFAATLTGASATSVLLALIAGAAALAIATGSGGGRVQPQAPIEETGPPALPEASELLETVADPVLIVRNRKVLFANPAARAVLGEHIEGVDVRLAIRHPAAAERLVEGGSADLPGTTRTELVGLGERDRRWEMSTSVLKDGSRLVRLSDRSEAHASEQMRTDFVANASHELRTPLATLLGYLETLQDADAAGDPAVRSRFLRIMFDEAKRMHRLVDDLISLSRIEAERFTMPRESVALLPLVDEIRRSCRTMIEEKDSDILVEHGGPDPIVLGDRLQLLQLLQNLIVNALKYGNAGAPVTVRFETGPEMLRFSVIDRGEGIAPEHLPRLTERFYRVDPSRSRAMGGTGLGLAIVKHIVGRHRGRLNIRSTPGEGTTVEVSLPATAEALSSKSHRSVTEDSRTDTRDASGAG